MQNPQQVAAAWQRGISNATEKVKAGVNAVSVAPSEKAIAAIPRMVQGIQEAAANGKIARGLRRVGLQDWKQSMLDKGVPRMASGAASAQPKFATFMAEFLPHVQAGVDQLNSSLPRGDLETNLQRMVAMARHNAQFSRRAG